MENEIVIVWDTLKIENEKGILLEQGIEKSLRPQPPVPPVLRKPARLSPPPSSDRFTSPNVEFLVQKFGSLLRMKGLYMPPLWRGITPAFLTATQQSGLDENHDQYAQ